ncbi:MAG: hypothetical protein RR413_10145 [Christensenellaceae bacterium]
MNGKEGYAVAEETYNFQKLTPISDADLSIYKNALDFVFENSDIKNVGVSGAYSAGKSSVIETYKKLNPDVQFMHLSLAYFQSASDSDNDSTETNENVLEGKILNQLIHQINPTNIPQTNFRVKRQLLPKKSWQATAIVSIFALLLIYLFNFGNWSAFVASLTPRFFSQALLFTTAPLTAFLAGGICIGILSFLIHELIKMQSNKNLLKGISVQGNTIEIFEQSEESYFDKYLNEVLYLFENSGKDVIVFEDMDRYNTNQIFQRLREINNLVNSRKKDTEKPMRFFYLLRDDIFVSKERTKFFDFIMPVVPILDGSNSFDQFIAHFKKGNIHHLFNEHFLQEISLYIDDMRILKNIYNEFLIYNKRINTTEQDPNKLLAIVIYKNIFPRDFSELQLNRGFVHTLFDKKDEFIKDEIAQLKDEIIQINSAMQSAKNEHLGKVEEVNELYDPKIQNLSRYGYGPYHDQMIELKKQKNVRIENIMNKSTDSQNSFKKEISAIEVSIAVLHHKKLHEIVGKQNSQTIFKITYTNEIGKVIDFNDIKGSEYFPLIKYLIKEGYIDETYPDYMTYFYEHSLSRIDKIFLRSVSDEDAKDYGYQLRSPSMVLARLSTVSFEKEDILNFDLLSYLLDNQISANETKMLKMLQQIKISRNFKFIDQYFAAGKPIPPFITTLNSIWPTAFGEILDGSDFTDERKKQYALESLYNTGDDKLCEVDAENALSGFVSTHKDFLDIVEPKIERLMLAFELLDVKFENIDYECSNKELFKAVYQNDCYVISFELVCLMLKKMYALPNEEQDLKNKNYTLISSKANEPLENYVRKNIGIYVEMILSHCGSEISDSEETAIKLLNDSNLSTALKENYIDKLKTPISSLSDITDATLWSELLACNLVVYSEVNVLQYSLCSNDGFDKLLADFVNNMANSFQFDYDTIDNSFEKGSASKFFDAVVTSKDLNVKPYASILKSLNRQYRSFNIVDIADLKIDVLIDQGVITMNEEVLLFMREHYPQKMMRFIVHNVQNYTEETISAENFDFDEMCEILDTDVEDKYKLLLLQHTDKPISVMGDAYSDEIKAHILENNLETADIPHLVKAYPTLTQALQVIIENIAIKNIEEIIESEYSVPMPMCKKLFTHTLLSTENQLQLFAVAIDNFNENECKECLEILHRQDILSAFAGKRPPIPITDTHKKILDALVKKSWIVGYSVDKKDANMYRVSSKRVPKHHPLPVELL